MADKEFNVKISAETDDFSNSLNKAEKDSSKFADALEKDIPKGAESATESLKETIEKLRQLQREAIGVKTSFSTMNNEFKGTSSNSNKFNKEMQRLSMILGGDVPESTKKAYSEMYRLHEEARKASRYYGKYSQQAMNARDAITKFALGLDDTTFKQIYMRSQLGLTDMQLRQQANSIKLNARMTKLMGNQTKILTERMKGLQKYGIKPEMMLPPSTIGQFQLLNETMEAGRSPLKGLSLGYRKLGGSVEKVIKNYSAQKVAIREAQGDMVKYGLLLRGITASNANMALAFPIVGMAALFAYKTMFSAALEADEGLKKLAETTKGKVLKALEPVIQTAGQFLKVALKVTGVVSDWIAKFNEAHPIIAKIAGAIGFLLPVMTLLLLPLQMGINLWDGWMVVLNGVWTMFGGVISMIGLASSTFLAFAGIIGVVSGAFMYLWKTNEGFKNGVTKAWDFMKQKASDVFGTIATYLTETIPNAYKSGGVEGVFNSIFLSIKTALANITTLLPQWIQKGFEIINNLLLGIGQAMPQVYEKSTEIITNLMTGLTAMMPTFVKTAFILLQSWLTALTNNLPIILNGGIEIVKMLIQGIIEMLPMIVSTVITVLTTFLQIITDNLPTILNAGIEMIISLVDGIVDSLPMIIDAVTKTLDTFVNFILDNLPMIIDSGIEIITTLATAIIDNLPKIIDATLELMLSIVESISNNLPKIIDSAGKIITSLVKGLVQGIPKILSAGIELVVGLCEGLIQSIPKVTKAAGDIVKDGIDAVKNKISDWVSIGGDIVKGLADGIKNAGWRVINSIKGAVQGAIDWAKNKLGINSPSKLFMQFGEWTTEGYQIGVDRGEPASTRAVENFAQNSVNAFTDNSDILDNRSVNESVISSNNTNNLIDYNKMYEVMINAFSKAIENTGMNDPKFNIDGKELTNIISPKIARTARGW